MNAVVCTTCGEPLDPRSRADRTTCSSRCRVAAWRTRQSANGSAAGLGATPLPAGASLANVAVTSGWRPAGGVHRGATPTRTLPARQLLLFAPTPGEAGPNARPAATEARVPTAPRRAWAVLEPRPARDPVGMNLGVGVPPLVPPSDRLVRVLAEGLRSIEERRAREQTEFRNRAIIVPPKTEEPSDEPAPEP